MSKPKTQNSILVLATLGVYLGLVLVGATPQVLAQAAMTKQFDVKDEIQKKDDVDDTPPLSSADFDGAITEYFSDLNAFVEDVKKLHSIDKFDPSFDTWNRHVIHFSPCPATGTLQSTEEKTYVDKWITPALEHANYAAEHFFWLADCLPAKKNEVRWPNVRKTGISLSCDKDKFIFGISVIVKNAERAQFLLNELQSSFELYSSVENDSPAISVLYKNTELTAAGDQVFIVTRLPRAGLDSLLATDAK